ncbi:MAG TPA: alginate lyase family protein [Thermoanaerobaculia bacterium]|nr:alginate lyase family protein [Thermoanaerobaculia bacterium]
MRRPLTPAPGRLLPEAGCPGRLARLGEMGAAELRYRLGESLRRGVDRAAGRLRAREESDRRFLRRLPAAPRDAGAAERQPPFLAYLRRAAAPRFYAPVTEREGFAELLTRSVPGAVAAIAAEAERLCAHRFELLGHGEIECGAEIDWHRDPVSGEVWERRFWGDYDLVNELGMGDPKRVHELNRHQHLPRLAKAWFLLGEERYAREVVRQLLGWIDQNPPGRGVHWHSSLEIALRVLSWLWALLLILPSRALDEAAARRIGKSLFAQLAHVHAYPSVFSSPNTHLLGEAAALFVGGLVFADCADGRAWRDRGAHLLAAEIDRQVLSDGVHAELSTGYHCYALDFYLQALALAGRNGFELPGALARRVETMAEFVLHVARPDGSLPLLGDDDGGRALALVRTSYGSAADLLSTAAALFGRRDFRGRAGRFREESLWLLGAAGLTAFAALPPATPAALRAAFPAAGYFVQRSGWRALDSHLVFDCGGLGRPSGGHGHADALALTLASGGSELLVDPGTFVYNRRPAWRDAFRSTRAHNTVVVDGRDQSEPGDTFRWLSRAPVRLLADASHDGLDWLAGEHHGYAREAGVVHRRRLLYPRPDYWLVLDDFRSAGGGADGGGGEHDFEVVFHLAPDAEVVPAAGSGPREAGLHAVAGGAGLVLFLHASAPVELALEPGWISRRYGEKRPAPVAVARFRAPLPAAVVTVLVPYRAAAVHSMRGPAPGWRPRALPARPEGALAIAVRQPGGEDLAELAPGAPEVAVDGRGGVAGGPVRARGEAFWARLAAGRLRRLLAIEATRFELGGAAVLESAEPVTRHSRHGGPPAPPSLRSSRRAPRPASGPARPAEAFREGVEPCAE